MPLAALVVDDSPLARKMLIKTLRPEWDMVVKEVCSGVEAMEACRAARYDIMFLDLTMPEMDGYQVLDALRTEAIKCPAIVVSADIQPRAKDRVMAAGALAFIKKPVDAAKVDAILKQHGIVSTES